MDCPACNSEISKDDKTCSECGYGFDLLTKYYKNTKLPKKVSFLNDYTDTFTEKQRVKLYKTLINFQRQFEKLFFIVYLESTDEKASTKGLWLHNKINFSRHEKIAPQYGLLLYIDPKQQVCSISFGLGLSPYITLEEVTLIIEKSKKTFSHGNYFKGVNTVIRKTSLLLSKKCLST